MEKKKQKNNDERFIDKFKNVWAVPRYKALIKLGLYAVFFLTLFLISYVTSNIGSNKVKNSSSNNNENVKFDSYTYIYKINKYIDDNLYIITYSGTSTNDTDTGLITYSDNKANVSYIVDKKNNKVYLNGVETLSLFDEIDYKYFSYEELDKLIKQSDNGFYIDESNKKIKITSKNSLSKKTYFVDFYDKYSYIGSEKVTLELELYNIK